MWLALKRCEPMMPIEAECIVVLSIDYEREHPRFRPHRPLGRVREERAGNATAAEPVVDRKAADQHRRQHGITRQSLHIRRGQVSEGKARCRQRVIAGDQTAIGRNGDEAIGDAATDVLCDLFAEIAIKSCNAAKEFRAIVARQRFDRNLIGHRDEMTSLRCRSAARRNAGVGSGGLRIAAAMAR